MSVSRMWRRPVVTMSLVALLGLTVSATGIAQADEFETGNTAPTIVSSTLPDSIQPDTGASATTYSYAVAVSDAEALNDLETITVCLYLTSAATPTCGTPNPATNVKLTWTQAGNAFSMDDGSAKSYWALGTAGDVSTSPTLTGTSGTFTFRFTVSEAMSEGEWTAVVTADDSDAVDSDSAEKTTVNHYSSISTRADQDFGIVNAGATGVTRTASPTVKSNGETSYSATAGNFTNGTYTFVLKTDGATSDAAGAGEVTFDCNVDNEFSEGAATRVAASSTELSGAETLTGTAEDGIAIDNTCRLAHGGERPVGDYSFIVVNAIGNG